MSKLIFLSAILLSTAFSATLACDQRDLTALLAFKNSFAPNSFPDSWNTAFDCCGWDYISCDETTGRVTSLIIKDNKNLKGSIPPSIGDLSALQLLYFANLPGLAGPIPSQFSKLTALQTLTIFNTKVSGAIPSYLSTFTGLREVSLTESAFVGTIPASLGDLVNLDTIYLSGNQLTGSIPDSLFSKLAAGLTPELDLSRNMLTGSIPKALGNVALVNIDVRSNELTGDASFLFGKSKTATFQIALSKNKLAFDLTNLQYPPNLQYLDISHNQIYGGISNQVTELRNLRFLDMSYNKLCGKIPSGGSFRQFGAELYANNKCLCGTPLPPCK